MSWGDAAAAARNPEIKSPPNTLWFLNIAESDYPGRVHPCLGEGGLEGHGGWKCVCAVGGSFSLPFTPSFPSWCRTHPVIFPTQVKQELCVRLLGEHCSVGFGGFFLRLKLKGGCLSNCCLLWAWRLEQRWSFDAATELGFGAWLHSSVHTQP